MKIYKVLIINSNETKYFVSLKNAMDCAREMTISYYRDTRQKDIHYTHNRIVNNHSCIELSFSDEYGAKYCTEYVFIIRTEDDLKHGE